MKHAILATFVAAFAGFTPASQAQDQSPVSQRLMQIDLDVATRHYEKLQGLLRDARLEQIVGQSVSPEASESDQKKLARKIDIIAQLTDETRMEILKLGQALEEAGATMDSGYQNKRAPKSTPRAGGSPYGTPSDAPVPRGRSQVIPGGMAPPVVDPAPAVEALPPTALVVPDVTPPAAAVPGLPAPTAMPRTAPVPVPVNPTPAAVPVTPAVPGAAGNNYINPPVAPAR